MASGYEKSDDYGGPRPGMWMFVGIGALFIAALILTYWSVCRLRPGACHRHSEVARSIDGERFALVLPPLAEQHRIVAKIDALMALCNRPEASLTGTAATRCRLLDALLAEALAPADAREMEAAE